MMNTESFIAKAQKIHGNEFTYTQTRFINWKTPLIIECTVHGEFKQWPVTHLKGAGCKRCRGIRATAEKTLQCAESFVERARNVHGNKYDYSKTFYEASNKKVTIICKLHGEFQPIASAHLEGTGCRFCSQILNQTNALVAEKKRTVSKTSIAYPGELTRLFVGRAIKIHENRYDYKNVVYINNRTKINIICCFHGSFRQRPYAHLKGAGCKACADIARGEVREMRASSQFIEKSQKIHGTKYDYSKSVYLGNATKLEIICLIHGPFSITPSSHLNGSGCDPCGIENMRRKQSTGKELFITQARAKHGDKYDYTDVVYVSTHRHVSIICFKHGPFSQAPSGHLSGYGCAKCGFEKNAIAMRSSTEAFIAQAKLTHGEKYDYSQAIYVMNSIPLTIICFIHGPFLQRPDKHSIAGHGCQSCANRDMDTEKFILRAREAHGEKYDYSKSKYTTAKQYVVIICQIHGEFRQAAWNHMDGTGCELCVDQMNSRGVQRIELWLIKNNIAFIREKKFETLKSIKKDSYFLRFDFFIEEHNLLIEYDGEQHYKPLEHWGGDKAFQQLIKNDEIKNIWAINNGYELIRINYKEINLIEEILSRAINIHLLQ